MIQTEVAQSGRHRFLRITTSFAPPHAPDDLAQVLSQMHRRGELPLDEVLIIEFRGTSSHSAVDPEVFDVCKTLDPRYIAFATRCPGDRWVIAASDDPVHYPLGALLEECSPR